MSSTSQQTFGQINFGDARLGDARRTRRLIASADLMARRPGGSLPQKFRRPKDLKAFYRLMECESVTHEAILQPHRSATLKQIDQCRSAVLVLHDSTELDFSGHASLTSDLGQIGNGKRRGYIVQNSLAIDSESRRVLGLFNQVLHHRADVPAGESKAQKRVRESRESRLWLRGVEPLGADQKLVDVCDQGADTFEFLEHEVQSGRRFLIRAAYDRSITAGHHAAAPSESLHLRSFARTLPPAGHWTLSVTSREKKKSPRKRGKKQTIKRIAREAKMAVSFAAVEIRPPTKKNGEHGNAALQAWVVRVWEVDPPEGQERLEWFLLTNEPVTDFAEAYRVVGWYECRWIIEEFHKGMKTGCQIQSPQFTSEERLKPAIGLLSIVTLTLLEMRDASRQADAKTRPATEMLSEDYVSVLSAWRHRKIKREWTIHEFCLALARLGGHQNRKSDHPPGWQTLWEGWKELQAMVAGVEAMKELERSG